MWGMTQQKELQFRRSTLDVDELERTHRIGPAPSKQDFYATMTEKRLYASRAPTFFSAS